MSQTDVEYSKPVKIDLSDPTAILPDEDITLNPDGDAFAGVAPTPDGEHIATLKLGPRGITAGTTRSGHNYYNVHVECRVIAEGQRHDNFPVFDNVSTLISDFTGTSRMAGVLKALREPVPARTTLSELVKQFAKALEGQPRVKVVTRWEADQKQSDGKYKTIRRGMKKFPEITTGNYSPTITVDGEEVTAQAKVTKYLPFSS